MTISLMRLIIRGALLTAKATFVSGPSVMRVSSSLYFAANFFNRREIFGTWEIHIADFSTEGGPHISNDRVIDVGDGNLFEPHGFSPDDQKILFSADIGMEYSAGLDLFTYDLSSGELKNLTNSPNDYDEHARYSPDGRKIVWGSSSCCNSYNKKRFLGTLISEAFIMNSDGSNKMQVTHFHEKGYPESYDHRSGIWPNNWLADGKSFMVADQRFDKTPNSAWRVTISEELLK